MKLYPNEPVKICNPWKLNPLKVNDATVLSLFFYISFIKNNFLFLLIKFFVHLHELFRNRFENKIIPNVLVYIGKY